MCMKVFYSLTNQFSIDLKTGWVAGKVKEGANANSGSH